MAFRKVERQTANGGWEAIRFAELKKGDLFTLYDSDSDGRVEDGNTVYIAKSDAEVCHDSEGNFVIEADYA